MYGESSLERIDCSVCRGLESESSADLAAKSSPEWAEAARETVAVEPRPIVKLLVQSIGGLDLG